MCGLAGLISFSAPLQAANFEEIDFILKRIKSRGPDSQNIKSCGDYAALGGARLRMTDTKNIEADLPMTSACGRYVAVLNGEIYNHLSLRNELPDRSYRTKSDTETLIAAFQFWGLDCLEKLEGMFAFAIYDQKDRKLYLAKDPAGQKPLYYLQDKEAFVFSSDIKSLIANPYREKSFCPESLSEFISQRMILGTDTHIKEISKLEGGTALIVDSKSESRIKSYYKIPVCEAKFTNASDIVEELKTRIHHSVVESISTEHESALLLSGGIDSTGLLALLQKNGVKPKTYAIGFQRFTGENFDLPTTFNEFEYSRLAASHFNTDHTEISISAGQYLEAIGAWSQMMGEPLEASEAPLLNILFEKISEDGLRLAFSGSGPDEIFDGYGLGAALKGLSPAEVPQAYFDKFSWVFDVKLANLLPDSFTNMRNRVIGKMDQMVAPYTSKTDSPAQASQFINFHGRLQAYEFSEIDTTSMHHSIEVRSPLIAKPIIETAFSFNPELKSHQGIEKWIYKQAWNGIIPDSFISRKKTGFPTPIEFWFSKQYEQAIEDTLLSSSSELLDLQMIDPAHLKSCWQSRNPSYRCIFYRLYCLNLMMGEQRKLLSTPKTKN